MRAIYLIPAFVLLTASFHAPAQQAGDDQAFEKQLTNQERAEYQRRLGQAGDEQERKEINAHYREMVEGRPQSLGAGKSGQPNAGPAGGQGHGNPAASRPGPAGSKNKPQKSGH